MPPGGPDGVQHPQSPSVSNAPRTLHALYGSDAVRTVEDTLYAIADQSGHGAVIRGALRKVNDLPRYSEQLLRQTWTVWPAGAPQMSSRLTLDRRSTQNEVIVSPVIQNTATIRKHGTWDMLVVHLNVSVSQFSSLTHVSLWNLSAHE